MPNTVIEAESTGLKCVVSDAVTKEADITGLVKFLPLSDSPEVWAKEAVGIDNERKSQAEAFRLAGYDIKSATDEFVRAIFGE